MRQNDYIPNRGTNPAQLMMQFQQFKRDYYQQNGANADPKAAVAQYVQQNAVDQNTLNQAISLANQLGIK